MTVRLMSRHHLSLNAGNNGSISSTLGLWVFVLTGSTVTSTKGIKSLTVRDCHLWLRHKVHDMHQIQNMHVHTLVIVPVHM